MTPTLISVNFVEDALNCMRAANHDPAPLLTDLKMTDPLDGPISNELYGRLWWLIAQEMQDEFFGLGARSMRPGCFALMCHAVLHTKTLKQALHRALLFLSVVLEDPSGTLRICEGEAQIELTTSNPRTAFAFRTYWLILMGVTSWLVGRRIPLRGLDFACAEPALRSEYRQFFGAPVRFDATSTLMRFDASHLALPVIRNDQALTVFLREAPANILIRFRHDQGTSIAVRKILCSVPPTDWPTFEALARMINMSPATLRRQLKADGQSYLAVKNDLRLASAQKMLDQPGLSVAEISAKLGYSEPSAFFRAYRRWTSRSPRGSRGHAKEGFTS